MWKLADAVGAGTPDPGGSEAAAAPATPVFVANKPAPGQTGPRGLAPRTTYSRVNTGVQPAPTVGEQVKSMPPRGLESLPKLAHKEISMTHYSTRPFLQDLVKEAMAGTASKIDIAAEALRQQGGQPEQSKTASAETSSIPTDLVEKYASALEYVSKQANIELSAGRSSGIGPGEGPNALQVLTPHAGGTSLQPGRSGQASGKNQVPHHPGMAGHSDNKSPANAMATNIDMRHGEQPVDPMHNEHASNAAQKTSAVLAKNLAVVGLTKKANVLAKNLAVLGLVKSAEDAINPAQISAGKATATGEEAPNGVSAAQEGPVPAVPSDVRSQQSLVGSNEAAINYTRRQAKADPKRDLAQLLSEPALSAGSDKVLNESFANTGVAGAKIAAADLTKTAAAHALLLKLAEECESKPKGKEKKSTAAGGLNTPSGQSGFQASSLS